jgi:hypothetical protein
MSLSCQRSPEGHKHSNQYKNYIIAPSPFFLFPDLTLLHVCTHDVSAIL